VYPGRGDHYAVSIVAVADPAPPVITEQDLERDVAREIRRLIKRLSGRSERSLQEEVVRHVVLRLCLPCYARWIADPAGRKQSGSQGDAHTST
jgi:hypothetical protein